MSYLVRPNADARLFPDVVAIYSPSSKISTSVLAPGLTWIQRVAGWRLSPRGRLARLFLFHREAVAAEQTGNWKAADFYFIEILSQLKVTNAESDVWDSLIEIYPPQGARSDRKGFYSRVIDEIFLDTHCAFYNAYSRLNPSQKQDPKSRQFVHLEFATQLLELSQAPEEVRLAIVGCGLRDQMDAHARSEQWDNAVSSAAKLVNAFPNNHDFVQLSADVQFARALKILSKGDSETIQESNARSLERSVAGLEQLLNRYPDSAPLYHSLAELHRIRAINLANAGLASDALLANQKALTYWPLEAAQRDRLQLEELLKNEISQVGEMLKQVAQRPNAYLNARGLRLKRQADAGFAPANNYVKSEEAKALSTKSYEARTLDIWKRVGLAPPPNRWVERAGKLVDAMVVVQQATQNAPETIERTWSQVTRGDKDLAEIDGKLVFEFMTERAPADSSPKVDESVVRVLPVLSISRGKGSEPISYWAFSHQDTFLKVQAASAILLVLLAIVFTFRQHVRERARGDAWAQIENTTLAGDDLGTVTACESFFSTSPAASDARARRARDLYRAALVRWFGRLPVDLDSTALAHVERFREISAEWHDSPDGGAK
jgi:hypothetical protein